MKKEYVLLGIVFIVVISFIIYSFMTGNSNKGLQDLPKPTSVPAESVKQDQTKQNPPPMTIDKNKKYAAVINTSQGTITIELFADKTPITVNNFISLAEKNFYDKTVFHRVIKDFMIQGGDPKGDGTGGPGYSFADEPFNGEYTRGTIAMANVGPNTNGSQFFIMHKDYPLPKNYVIFGRVTEGLEVVDKIAESEVEMNNGEISKPKNPTAIKSVEIVNQ